MVIEKNNKKYNKSTVFLLPMLGISLSLFKNFYNVYYKTIYNNDNNEKRIYVVYKLENINEKVIKDITTNNYFINSYDVDGFSVFVYRIPAIYQKDFILFCNGKYNNFSKIYKNLILSSYSMSKNELNKILNTLPKDRQELAIKFDVCVEDIQEVHPIPDEIEETFSVSNNYKIKI